MIDPLAAIGRRRQPFDQSVEEADRSHCRHLPICDEFG
jgi:hypothetical protein